MLKVHLRTFSLGNHYNFLTMRCHKQGYLWEVELISRQVICHHCGHDKTVKAGERFSLVKKILLNKEHCGSGFISIEFIASFVRSIL